MHVLDSNFYKLLIRKLPFIICFIFFTLYSILAIIRHMHYGSFGYDLGINSQLVWLYSHFQLPVTTIAPFPDQLKLAQHVEIIFLIISPLYWIWSDPVNLIIIRTAWFCFSGVAVYLLAKKHNLNPFLSISLVVGYLGFYGVQNAIWFDVHSASFATGFLMWFIYFLNEKKKLPSIIFFFLAITAKENIALLTFLTSFTYFIKQRTRLLAFFMLSSLIYLFFVFFIFFPHVVNVSYLYAKEGGILSGINFSSFLLTPENIKAIWYSLASFGFLPLLSPLYLFPYLGDLATYFILGSNLPAAQGLFGHYRITLTPFLVLATIMTLVRIKKLNNKYVGMYLIICIMITQYVLHLPLSYLSKEWFWNTPQSVKSIDLVVDKYLPKDASVVAQNNIVPHVSERKEIYELYPEERALKDTSFCGKLTCDWFRWQGSPQFLLVDTASTWDTRHLLTNRADFINALENLEKAKIIQKYKVEGTTSLYKVNSNPDLYK